MIKRSLSLSGIFLCLFLLSQTAFAQPVVTSFTPLSGPVGTTVTITGTGFNTTASNNIVFFGATKASVSTASATSLTVTVPVGALHARITVLNTSSNLIAYSKAYFQPTFSPGKNTFIESDLAPIQAFTTGGFTVGAAIGDLDGDGKPDIVTADVTSKTVTIYNNTSSPGSITSGSFTSATGLTASGNPEDVVLSDVNADGKLDVLTINSTNAVVGVYLNTSSGTGNISFAAAQDFAVVGSPTRIAVGDFDGDGLLDIVTSSSSTNNVSVLRNTSSGGTISFATHVEFAVGTSPVGVVVGDMDGDGAEDIIAVNNGSSNISVLRNIASSGSITGSSFVAAQNFGVGGNPNGIAIGDLNGDNKLDISTTFNAGSGVYLSPNSSSGTGNINFGSGVGFSAGSSTYWTTLADMNGDGKLDVLATDAFNIYIRINNTSPGDFTSAGFSNQSRFSVAGSPRAVVGDLDGDGRPDIIGTNGTISVLRNVLRIAPVISAISPVKAAAGATVTISGTDFNTTASNNVVFFGATKAVVTGVTGSTILTVTVPADASYGPVSLMNTAYNTLAYSPQFFRPISSITKSGFNIGDLAGAVNFTTGITPNAVASSDIDGDGKADIVALNTGANTFSVLLNTSTSGDITSGSFGSKTDISTSSSCRAIAIGDLNGDGKPDIVTGTANGSSKARVFINTSSSGSVSFASAVNVTLDDDNSNAVAGIKLVDLDGDGKLDIIGLLSQSNFNVATVRNIGTPGAASVAFVSFPTSLSLNPSVSPWDVAVGDLNSDGKADFVAANYGGGSGSSVTVFTNTSTPGAISFATQVRYNTGTGPYNVALGDLDSDGLLDIITSNYANGTGSTVSVLRNTGSSFATTADFTTGSQPRGLALSDMNGDGKLDIVTSSVGGANANTISVLNNTSTSGVSFAAATTFGTGTLPAAIAINDLDGDGRPDILAVNATDNTVSVLRNTLQVSTDATLSALTTTAGTISPTFTSGTITYTASVTNATTSITVTPTMNDANANIQVRVNGGTYATVVSANASASLSINVGSNPVDVMVTAEDGTTTKTYTVTITRVSTDATLSAIALSTGTLSPTFAGGTIAYTASVPNATTSITLTPTRTEGTATIKVNTITVASGAASGSINLNIGTNTIATIVTAGDGTTTKTYTVTVTRATDPPIITSFSPGNGAPGTSVTITGINFNAIAGNNIVFFGATQAAITAATVTNLTVTVPAGATNAAITVLNAQTGLGAYSKTFFLPTFDPNKGNITSIDIASKVDFSSIRDPLFVTLKDIDFDGKPDILVAGVAKFAVLRNIGTSANPAFAAEVDFTVGADPRFIAIADIDGDGKQDVVTPNYSANTISILRNTSSPGTAAFAAKIDIATAQQPGTIAVGDMDGDGRPDLAVTSNTSNKVSVFLNTSVSGSISFAAKQDIITGSSPYYVVIGDIDGDGKPDLATINNDDATVSILRNTSVQGALAFAAKVDFAAGGEPRGMAIGDLDGDGKFDIAVTNFSFKTVSVLRNTSVSGNPSFAAKVTFATEAFPTAVSIGDIDGDGKADMTIISGSNIVSNFVSIFRNTGSLGNLNFASKVNFSTPSNPNEATSLAIGDIDSDSKPDLILSSFNTVSVFRNTPVFSPAISSFSPLSAASGATVTLTGTDFIGATSVSFGGIPAASYNIVSSTNITAVLAAGMSGNVSVVTPGGTATKSGFTFLYSDANLNALSLSAGALSPTFASATTSYTASVPNATTSITLTPTRTEGTATIKVNTVSVASAAASGSLPLAVGPNTITTVVTAGDSTTTKTYTVVVTRAASADATLSAIALSTGTLNTTFAGATTAYTASVPNTTTSITLTPTRTEGTATIRVNTVTVASAAASGSINLNVGANTITTIVTAGDGTTTKTYTVTVTRAASAIANLSAMTISSGTLVPAFTSATTSYTASVASGVSSITLTPTADQANATVTVNGTAVTSGSPSGAITLNVGINTITAEVTAQDGTTKKTYTVVVTRPSGVSNVANLSGLTLSSGTLNTAFASGTLSYTTNVPFSTSSLTITPTVDQANATVKVNGATVANAAASGAISLNVGSNTITTVITAQDGTTTKTYTITVTRAAAATIANLSGLTVSAGTLDPAFATATTSYSLYVNNSVASTTVTPVKDNAGATVKVNGSAVTSGTASGSIALAVGTNTITILVTAEDGTTTKTYTVKIIRLEPDQLLTDQSGNVTVNNTQTEVVITSPTQAITVTIPAGATTVPTVDYASLVSGGSGTVPQTTINSPLAKVEIPASTIVSGTNSTWTGTISAPKISDYDFPKVKGQTITKGLVIEVGDPNVSLTFTKAVRLILYGQAGMRIARVHGGVYTEITTVGTADSQAAGDALAADASFKINVGNDLVIWTKGFSQFITFTQDVDLNVALVAADLSELTPDKIRGANADLDHITTVLTSPLPATGSNGSAITWVSDKTGVLSNDGKTVNRPLFGSGSTTVTMTATITKGEITDTKVFTLTVLEQPNQAPTLTAIANQAAICFTNTAQTVTLAGITAGPESGQTVTVTATSSNAGLLSALTITGTGATRTITYIPANSAGGTTTITITVKDNGGTVNGGSDTFTRTFTVTINPLPVVAMNSNIGTEISKGFTAVLTASGGTSYTWASAAGIIGAQNTATLTVRPSVTTTYTVTTTNATSCTSVQSITITVNEDYKSLDASNIMTPNNDGKNDVLVIKNLDMYPNNTLKVFDRSGKIVYQKKGYTNDWTGARNGLPLDEDTYFWILDFGNGIGSIKGYVSIVSDGK